MKLRIKGNSLRLRLTQTEVAAIERGETVEETVHFGSSYPQLHYSMAGTEESGQISLRYQQHRIHVDIPASQARQWAASDAVSMETHISLEDGEQLYVLIEKDFQCLHKRPMEDESDHFPNPQQSEGLRD